MFKIKSKQFKSTKLSSELLLFAVGFSLLLKVTGTEKSSMDKDQKLKSAVELKQFKVAYAKAYNERTGKHYIWGNSKIPPMISPRGKVLFEDNFTNLKNWHHEGVGKLTLPGNGIMQLNCIGSKQGKEGTMAFCRQDFPDNICIEYDLRLKTKRGLIITFIAARGRRGEDMISGLPPRTGVFTDYTYNSSLRCYHLSLSRYNDKGEHTNTSNWVRNPGKFLMGHQADLCKTINCWYRIRIIKQGKLLQLSVNGKLAGGFIDSDKIPEPIPGMGKIGFRAIGADVIAQIKNFKVIALK